MYYKIITYNNGNKDDVDLIIIITPCDESINEPMVDADGFSYYNEKVIYVNHSRFYHKCYIGKFRGRAMSNSTISYIYNLSELIIKYPEDII